MRALSLILPALFAAVLGCGRDAPQRPFTVVMRLHPVLTERSTGLKTSFRNATGRELAIVTLPADDYDRHVLKLLADRIGDPPDLVESGHPALPYYLKTALPFNGILDDWPRTHTDGIFNDFIRLRTDAAGKVYALSMHYPEPQVLVMRQDWLNEDGTAVPTTVRQLMTAARAATARSRNGFRVFGYGWDGPMPHLFMKAGDGGLIGFDRKTGAFIPAFTSAMGLDELTSLSALYRSGAVSPGQFDGTARAGSDLFRTDALMFLITDTRMALRLHHAMPHARITVAGLPRGTVKPVTGTVPAWCRTSPATEANALIGFLNWWYGTEATAILTSSEPDAYIPAWLQYDRSAAALPDSGFVRDLYRIAGSERIRFNEHPRLPEITEIVDRYWAYAVTDSMKPADATAAAVREISKKRLLR